MAHPAKDARDKAQTKWPGAMVFERGKNRIKHQHPSNPNRFMLDVSIGPLHYGVGEDQEIDTAWQPGTAPWDYEMVKAGYNAYALSNFSFGQIIKYIDPDSGEDVAFQPQQLQYTNDLDQIQPIENPQSVIAAVSDDELYWTDAYGNGIDIRWLAGTESLWKGVVINSATDLPAVQQFIIDGGNPVLRLQFIFQKSNNVEIWVNGILWDEKPNNPVETSGYVEWKHKTTGEVLWCFDIPRSLAPNNSDPTQREMLGTFRLRKTGPNLIVEHRIPVDWLQSAIYPIEIDVTIDRQTAASADDGGWKSACTMFNNTGTQHTVGQFFSDIFNMYARFLNVTVPNGATIDVSYISEKSAGNGESVWLTRVYANDIDTAVNPTTCAEANALAKTAQFVDWDPGAWVFNTWYDSPSLNSVIKEVVDRGGWVSGNDLMTLHLDDGCGEGHYITIRTWNFAGNVSGPKLHIEYTLGAAGQPTMIRTQGVPTGPGSRDRPRRLLIRRSLWPACLPRRMPVFS